MASQAQYEYHEKEERHRGRYPIFFIMNELNKERESKLNNEWGIEQAYEHLKAANNACMGSGECGLEPHVDGGFLLDLVEGPSFGRNLAFSGGLCFGHFDLRDVLFAYLLGALNNVVRWAGFAGPQVAAVEGVVEVVIRRPGVSLPQRDVEEVALFEWAFDHYRFLQLTAALFSQHKSHLLVRFAQAVIVAVQPRDLRHDASIIAAGFVGFAHSYRRGRNPTWKFISLLVFFSHALILHLQILQPFQRISQVLLIRNIGL